MSQEPITPQFLADEKVYPGAKLNPEKADL